MTPSLRGAELARHVDISCVQAFHTATDVENLADVANTHAFVAAHALPHFVPLLKQCLGQTTTLVGAPVGFPSGGETRSTKIAEARELAKLGAQELDLVVNLARLIDGDTAYVGDEIKSVVDAVAPLPLKAILEVGYLSDDRIRLGCDLAIAGGARFVKTSTGWIKGGSIVEKVAVIAAHVRGAIAIKASGGIRDFATIDALANLGVTRFGINSEAAVRLVSQVVES